MQASSIANFGRNQRFTPQIVLSPRSEAEVLEILERYHGRQIRCIGRLHSWSAAPTGEDVILNLAQLREIRLENREGETWAVVGAGCQIKQVLAELARAGFTLPTLGLITEQTLVGAAATGTHGSGRSSLAHHIGEVRIAVRDPVTGVASVRVLREGPELQAARCSLGCLGVIVSVALRCREAYRIEEHFHRYATLDEVLAAETEYPLQQFYFVPWRWDYFAQHRREVVSPRSRLATLYRVYFFAVFDISFHVILLLLQRMGGRRGIRTFFRHILPWTVVRNWKVVDDSSAMLVMEHELFRHIEIEVFVRQGQLAPALAYVRELLRHAHGEDAERSVATPVSLDASPRQEDLASLRGVYTHHYPICIRKVLPDDALLSMTSDWEEPGYALSFISYARPRSRAGFLRFATVLGRTMATRFGARCHWGKVNPLSAADVAALYPSLPTFRAVQQAFDPERIYSNAWLREVLG